MKEKLRILQQQRQRLYPTIYNTSDDDGDENAFEGLDGIGGGLPTTNNTNNIKQILDYYAVDYFLDVKNDSNDTHENCENSVVEPRMKKSKLQIPSGVGVLGEALQDLTGSKHTVGLFHDECNEYNDTSIPIVELKSIVSSTYVDGASDAPETVVSKRPNDDFQQTNFISSGGNTTIHTTQPPLENLVLLQPDVLSTMTGITSNDDLGLQQPLTENPATLQHQPTAAVVAVTTLSSSIYDIWGRIPPKEYIATNQMNNSNNNMITTTTNHGGNTDAPTTSSCMMICSICQQKVGSSLRYASHLDKCLGIGTMSRNNNNNNNNNNNYGSNTSSAHNYNSSSNNNTSLFSQSK